ncbi:hypothetical protein BT69DRAFT_1304397 [Atractiella rhizophila]|nr:hypothetical protein BT69DRAFT_1304397 [Atractiella rhizophila]
MYMIDSENCIEPQGQRENEGLTKKPRKQYSLPNISDGAVRRKKIKQKGRVSRPHRYEGLLQTRALTVKKNELIARVLRNPLDTSRSRAGKGSSFLVNLHHHTSTVGFSSRNCDFVNLSPQFLPRSSIQITEKNLQSYEKEF